MRWQVNRRDVLISASSIMIAAKAHAWTHGVQQFSTTSQQFFDRLLTPPNEATAVIYNSLINSLVASGVWALLDVLAVYATSGNPDISGSDTSLINLVQSSFQQGFDTVSGNMTFTPNLGWSGGEAPANNDINTFFNPSTAGGHFAQNNAMFCAWQIGGGSATALIADSANDNAISLAPLQGGNTDWAVNGNGTLVSTANGGNGSGFWLAQRTGPTASALYKNASQVATSSNVSAALINSNIVTGTATATSGNSIAAFACGASLSAGQITALYNALSAYLTAIGAI